MAHIALICGRSLFIFLAVYSAKYVISHSSIYHCNSLCLAFLVDLTGFYLTFDLTFDLAFYLTFHMTFDLSFYLTFHMTFDLSFYLNLI